MSNIVVLPGRASKPAPGEAADAKALDHRRFVAARDELLDISSNLMNVMPLLGQLQRLIQDEMVRLIAREAALERQNRRARAGLGHVPEFRAPANLE